MGRILVTGASSGIGLATAQRLLSDGHEVYAAARRVEPMEQLAALGARPIALDVADDVQCDAAMARILVDGPLDALVNNAGFGLYGAVEDTTIDDARYQFEVNLFGPARLTRLALPGMREQGRGRIINVSSMGGRIYTPLGAWYHASKHAIEGWSDCLRLELASHGIQVVVIQPGVIRTDFGEVVGEPMLRRSGAGAYAALAKRAATATEQAYEPGRGTPPSVIADVISRAVSAGRPRTRYVAGQYARPMMMLRKWFGDRVFDRAIMSRYG